MLRAVCFVSFLKINDWAGNLGRQIPSKPLDVIAVRLNNEVCCREAKGVL